MFSSDQNIETIAQLVEAIRRYVKTQGEYARLSVMEKTVRIITVLAMMVIFSVLFLGTGIFLSFAVVFALEPLVGLVSAFLIVAAIYLLLLLLIYTFRKKWIVRPLVRFLLSND
ncbi:putative uncharacterized protein [Prevotella sp. CAG:924]|nr:putative uncharacterized protein [Prevotella sp. CAG:924]